MTIGANLNGGSLTLGSANANGVALSTKKLVSIATDGLQANGVINIATGNNGTGSYVLIGNNSLGSSIIRGNSVVIGDNGLSATGNILIGSGANNATGSYIMIGDTSLPNCYIRGNAISIADNGGEVFIAGGGLAANKRIRIGNGANGAETELHLGSSSLSRMYIKGGDVNINHLTSANTNIGSEASGLTTILGNTNIGNTGLPINGGISIGAGNNGAGSFAQLGSNTLPTLYLRASYLNINDNNNSGTVSIGSSGNTYFFGNIRMGNNSPTFKNIIAYTVDQSADFPNAASPRYISFNHTFNSPPCLSVTIISNINNYVAFASVRTISTTGFTYNFTLMCLSPFFLFLAGYAHTICYTAIGT